MPYDQQKAKELKEAQSQAKKDKAQKTLKKYNSRKNKNLSKDTIKSAKNLIKSATPWGIFSLMSQGSIFSDWMYGLALFAAVFKDLFDLIEVTGIGYIIVIITTFCCSIFIAFMMILGSFSNGFGRMQQKVIRSWLVLLGGTTAELLFGVNFLPIETLTVLIIYAMLLSDRKQSKEKDRSRIILGEQQENFS